jgi:hypothetical protein
LSLEKHRLLFRNVHYKNKTPPTSSNSCFCYASLFDKRTIYFSNATCFGSRIKWFVYISIALVRWLYFDLVKMDSAVSRTNERQILHILGENIFF